MIHWQADNGYAPLRRIGVRPSMSLRPNRASASVIACEDVLRVALGQPYFFTVRSTDPDVLVVIADRNGLAGCGPCRPPAVDPR
jgi:hypothetical protein